MATATATLTLNPFPNGKDQTLRRTIYSGTLAIQSSPATYATGGLAITWSQLTNAAGEMFTAEETTPIVADFWSAGGSGYIYAYNQSTGKVQIFTGAAAQSALTELTNSAAIPSGVSGDTIYVWAEFLRAA